MNRGLSRGNEQKNGEAQPGQTRAFVVQVVLCAYRGNSLIRKQPYPGPYCRPMPRVLGGSQGPRGVLGGWAFSYERGSPVTLLIIKRRAGLSPSRSLSLSICSISLSPSPSLSLSLSFAERWAPGLVGAGVPSLLGYRGTSLIRNRPPP
jgi:hypothetical protein